jgi:hypothetical protein
MDVIFEPLQLSPEFNELGIDHVILLTAGIASFLTACFRFPLDPDRPLYCGIALEKPQNIWGLSLPPIDWHEGESE